MSSKELCKVQFMKTFEDYYDFKQKNIILNSIRVATLDDNDKHFKKIIPFDIQVAGENGFRIRPCFSKGKFLVMYECMMKAYKVTIPSNAFPYSINENGDFEICIPL